MKRFNIEFNESNIKKFGVENNFNEAMEWSPDYSFGIISMEIEEYELFLKIEAKCGEANQNNLGWLTKKAFETMPETKNYQAFLRRLDEKIEEKINSSKIKLIEEDGYFLFDGKVSEFWNFRGFCHHSKHEALYYYYLETMELEDFWF